MQISTTDTNCAISAPTDQADSRFRIRPNKKFPVTVETDLLEPFLYRGDVVSMDPTLAPAPGDIVLARAGDGSLHLGHFQETAAGSFKIDSAVPVRKGDAAKVVAVYRAP